MTRMLNHLQTTNLEPLPIACNLNAIPLEKRSTYMHQVQQLFSGRLRELRELEDGYAYRFDAADLQLVSSFISKERLCCPFLTFVLELAPQGGPLWLQLTGQGEIKPFLREEFGQR